MLIILCVDDAGIAAPNKESINELVEELRNKGFDLEMEGDFTECLGIKTEHQDDGSACMTQKGLIKKIIATAKMQGCKPNKTPTVLTALGSDASIGCCRSKALVRRSCRKIGQGQRGRVVASSISIWRACQCPENFCIQVSDGEC